jgi:hypothetical protein
MEKALQPQTELWEAWIEFDPLSSDSFGRLYVLGEVLQPRRSAPPLLEARVDPGRPSCLELHLHINTGSGPLCYREVCYSEALPPLDRYTSILICQDGRAIAEITEMEVLV